MSYQSQKFNEARRNLMLPHPGGEATSIATAFLEVSLGMQGFMLPADFNEDARAQLEELLRFMDTMEVEDPNGRGRWQVKAELFTLEERARIASLIDQLAWWFSEYGRR